jgi:hypothetical protein
MERANGGEESDETRHFDIRSYLSAIRVLALEPEFCLGLP